MLMTSRAGSMGKRPNAVRRMSEGIRGKRQEDRAWRRTYSERQKRREQRGESNKLFLEALAKITYSVNPANPGSSPGQAPESGIAQKPGFRVALRLPGMVTLQ